MKRNTQDIGNQAEALALQYLTAQGLTLVTRNFRTKSGEIDLIMRDGDSTVFIEVRSRQKNSLVNSLESIDHHKQRKLIRSAQYYLKATPTLANQPARFDVVAVTRHLDEFHTDWIKDAFQT
ncbi:MAG: YraN family protein [Gammaproteobacteria bacterium]|nr:YraN family protein [Gammaproteobacteria bacterium]